MKKPARAIFVTLSPAPFHAVQIRLCNVLELFPLSRTASVEFDAQTTPGKVARVVRFEELASDPARALALIDEKTAQMLAQLTTATDQKSAAQTKPEAPACIGENREGPAIEATNKKTAGAVAV